MEGGAAAAEPEPNFHHRPEPPECDGGGGSSGGALCDDVSSDGTGDVDRGEEPAKNRLSAMLSSQKPYLTDHRLRHQSHHLLLPCYLSHLYLPSFYPYPFPKTSLVMEPLLLQTLPF